MPLSQARNKISFPAATEDRFYITQTPTITTNTPTRYTINYIPYVIKKDTSNLSLCFEQTVSGSQAVIVGIYDGSSGIASAPLLFSATINTNGSGIYTSTSSLFFKSGYYIVAGMATSATPLAGRSFTTNAHPAESFGRPSTEIVINSLSYYTQTGLTDLPSNIGTITYALTNTGANVFLKY